MLERLKPERPKRPPSKRVKDAQRLARRGAAAKKEAEEPEWRAKGHSPDGGRCGEPQQAGQSQDAEGGRAGICFA